MVTAQVSGTERWPVGQRVVCPKCGREGKAGINTFRAKGREYTYLVVNHADARKCVIGRVRGPKAEVPTARAITEFVETPKVEVPAAEAPVVETPAPAAGTVLAAVEKAPVSEVPAFREVGPIPPGVDRAAWYALKIAASWGSVRENPSDENLQLFTRTARQIAQRVGVPVEDAVAAVEHYVRVRSEQAKVMANEAVKRVLARVIVANTAHFETFAEEAKRRVEEAVKRIEELSKVPEVRITAEEAKAMYATFRQKKKVPEEVRGQAYAVWDKIFSPGRKVVTVEA